MKRGMKRGFCQETSSWLGIWKSSFRMLLLLITGCARYGDARTAYSFVLHMARAAQHRSSVSCPRGQQRHESCIDVSLAYARVESLCFFRRLDSKPPVKAYLLFLLEVPCEAERYAILEHLLLRLLLQGRHGEVKHANLDSKTGHIGVFSDSRNADWNVVPQRTRVKIQGPASIRKRRSFRAEG